MRSDVMYVSSVQTIETLYLNPSLSRALLGACNAIMRAAEQNTKASVPILKANSTSYILCRDRRTRHLPASLLKICVIEIAFTIPST
jgi:hypothetical protein